MESALVPLAEAPVFRNRGGARRPGPGLPRTGRAAAGPSTSRRTGGRRRPGRSCRSPARSATTGRRRSRSAPILALGWQGWLRGARRRSDGRTPAAGAVAAARPCRPGGREPARPGTRDASRLRCGRCCGPDAGLLMTDGERGGQLRAPVATGRWCTWRYEASRTRTSRSIRPGPATCSWRHVAGVPRRPEVAPDGERRPSVRPRAVRRGGLAGRSSAPVSLASPIEPSSIRRLGRGWPGRPRTVGTMRR